ncbi:MAG: tetratricopeptide repeat protein [Alphaproteobacteria bacterium]|nr:tetratricopeptide repeat protein [Alphaproteobacteria bacterium]
MKAPLNIRARLIEIGNAEDDTIDLGDAALTLAAVDRPGVSLDPYRRHFEQLAAGVRDYAQGGAADNLDLQIEALVQVIIRRYGYFGSDAVFEDLDAANLMRVIDHRCGLPVAIGILFIATARAQGWQATGLDFPGRFLIRLDGGGERKIIDPFGGGEGDAPALRAMFKATAGNHVELTPGHFEGMGNRDILLRLQNNIKARLLQRDRFDDAVEVLETMVLIAPARADLWREVGILRARLDHIESAVQALEEHLRLTGADETRYKTSMLLQELRTRLN